MNYYRDKGINTCRQFQISYNNDLITVTDYSSRILVQRNGNDSLSWSLQVSPVKVQKFPASQMALKCIMHFSSNPLARMPVLPRIPPEFEVNRTTHYRVTASEIKDFPPLDLNYQWRENVVTVSGDVIDIKGAVSNTYKCMCTLGNTFFVNTL